MKKWLAMMLSMGMVLTLVGCGHETKEDHSEHVNQAAAHTGIYKDGTYIVKSDPDPDLRDAVGELTLTILNGKITQAEYKGIQKDGTVKDSDYGKTNGKIENREFYNKAQQALKGAMMYGPKLVETQDVDRVDSISGATLSNKQFRQAGHKALAQAQ